jgi:hypothetical protein
LLLAVVVVALVMLTVTKPLAAAQAELLIKLHTIYIQGILIM